jgi:hypothetical protein
MAHAYLEGEAMSQLEEARLNQVQEVLAFLDKFVREADVLSTKLRANLKVPEDDVRLMGLGQTQAVHAHEVLLICVPKWLSLSEKYSDRGRFELEFQSRVLETLRQQFISTMSAIEFCAKEAVKMSSPSPLATAIAKARRVYLSLIVEESSRFNLLSEKDRGVWMSLIGIRNMLVHNNGFADIATTYKVAGETMILVPGKMTEIDTFMSLPKFAKEVVFKYDKWLKSLFGGRE